jgi:hypothetical protein
MRKKSQKMSDVFRTLRQNPWTSFVSTCPTKRYGYFLEGPALRRRMGTGAHARVEAGYSFASWAARVVATVLGKAYGRFEK